MEDIKKRDIETNGQHDEVYPKSRTRKWFSLCTGSRFISINDDFDSDKLHGDTGGMNVAFKYLVSEFYSRDLSIKYKSAKYVKFRRGEYQSKTCPYGYRKGANGRMEPNEETAPNGYLVVEVREGRLYSLLTNRSPNVRLIAIQY